MSQSSNFDFNFEQMIQSGSRDNDSIAKFNIGNNFNNDDFSFDFNSNDLTFMMDMDNNNDKKSYVFPFDQTQNTTEIKQNTPKKNICFSSSNSLQNSSDMNFLYDDGVSNKDSKKSLKSLEDNSNVYIFNKIEKPKLNIAPLEFDNFFDESQHLPQKQSLPQPNNSSNIMKQLNEMEFLLNANKNKARRITRPSRGYC